MKIEMSQKLYPRRGAEVKEGNVYVHERQGRTTYKIVLGIIERANNRPFNNVVMLHVDIYGKIQGSSNQPADYVKNHHNLVGHCTSMPTLKIKWIEDNQR